MCSKYPPSPVCGPDGRNHLSRCAAINCAGIPAVDLLDGPCQSHVWKQINNSHFSDIAYTRLDHPTHRARD